MDTWATSSLSPQIAGRMLDEPELYRRIFPMQLRPQAHEIIRTWTFYTIVKSYFHFGALPWETVMLSGHALDRSGRKLSKSQGNAPVMPLPLIERHGADALRYWACRAGRRERAARAGAVGAARSIGNRGQGTGNREGEGEGEGVRPHEPAQAGARRIAPPRRACTRPPPDHDVALY